MQHRTLSVATLALAASGALAHASSHREAPFITEMPKVDNTDVYAFMSYEPGRAEYVTLIANFQPFQEPFGGPNYYTLDPDAKYRIHVDNTGDAIEDVTFELDTMMKKESIALNVGGTLVEVPQVNVGSFMDNADPDLNQREYYGVRLIRGNVLNPSAIPPLEDSASGSTQFDKPVDNIGSKSIPDYHAYAQQYVHDVTIPGCAFPGRLFVGQRKESFAVNVGEIFDLVNTDPLGSRSGEMNDLEGLNVTTFAIEVHKTCVNRNGAAPVIGVWSTAALRRNRALSAMPSFQVPAAETNGFVQVSRLGMPLVNEVVIGLGDKNRFNATRPRGDAAFLKYVTNPTLPEILELLFGVTAPNNFPRRDLVAAFLTGVDGLNKFGRPAEMQRLNTTIAPTPAASQNNLGVLGGDNAGFPNGRRPGDDVVDIELRVAMGVLCHAFPGVYCSPSDAPSGTQPFTDGVLQDASQFDSTFPYLTDPLPGSPTP